MDPLILRKLMGTKLFNRITKQRIKEYVEKLNKQKLYKPWPKNNRKSKTI